MARIEAITSQDLVYQVVLTSNFPRGTPITIGAWTGEVAVGARPPEPFEATVIKVPGPRGGLEFVDPTVNYIASTDRLTYGYGLICYDFRTNNEERTDTSGRPKKRMNNVKRIQSASLTFQVSEVAPNGAVFYIACLPKINLISIRGDPLVPHPLQLGMNYFLGYEEVYRSPISGQLVQDPRSGTSGNINPACFAGQPEDPRRPTPLTFPVFLSRRDSYPATVTVELKPRMLRALESAMRNGDVFGLAAVPSLGFGDGPEQFQVNTGRYFWASGTQLRGNLAFSGRIRSGLNASYNPPVLRYKYALDNNKINTGAGTSRISTSGFMEGNMFSGTNSGFSE